MTQAIDGLQTRLRTRRGALVDSNVPLDIATNDPNWGDWSVRALAEVAEHTTVIINPTPLYQRESFPWETAFLGRKSFLLDRRQGGSRTSRLPDFYIGAHAAIERLALYWEELLRFR